MPLVHRFFLVSLNVAFAALGLAVCVSAVLPAVIAAQDAARRAQVPNNLFQHSGSHEADLVQLDRNMRVISVSSCPLCNRRDAGAIFFVEGREGEPISLFLVPEASVSEARLWLQRYKQSPRYQEIRNHFSHPSEPENARPDPRGAVPVQNKTGN
jgi:hypothetical protein